MLARAGVVMLFILLTGGFLNAQINAPIQKPDFISDTIPKLYVPAKPFSAKTLIGIWYEHRSMLGDNVYHVICRDDAGALWYRIFRIVKGERIEQIQQNPLQYIAEQNRFSYADYIEPTLTDTLSISADSILLNLPSHGVARRVEYIGHVDQELWLGNKYYPITILSGWKFEHFSVYIYTFNGATYGKMFVEDERTEVRRYRRDEKVEKSVNAEGYTGWEIDRELYTLSKDGNMLSRPLYTTIMKGWRQTLKPKQ